MPLPFARSASQTRPTFSRDFAGLKTLDHGVGPAIRFERSPNGTATYFDANGVLQTVGNDVPRFDHSSTGSLGLLIEESRTNSIRNSQAGGSTNGVIGSGGALPTNWSQAAGSGGTTEVVASGTLNGFNYIDIKYSGTNSSGSPINVTTAFETITQIVASSGQTWTASFYASLVTGSVSGIASILCAVVERDSSGVIIAQTNATFTPTATLERVASTRTLGAPAGRVEPRLQMVVNNGSSWDLTLRIAAPQLEQGAFPTSYIPTTSAAATRSADSAVVTPISSFYNQSEGTLFAEFSRPQVSKYTGIVTLNSAADTFNEQITIESSVATPTTQRLQVTDGGVGVVSLTYASAAVSTIYKFAAGLAADNFASSQNGSSVLTDSSGGMPTVDRMLLAPESASGAKHIRKIAYYPKRLSNTLLQQLTT